MKILLTNDDGIDSPGINLLAKELRKAGHRVFVVAPDKNRSGCSHSISFLNKPCKLKEIEKDTWACSGTPVDCVVVALLGGIPEISMTDTDKNIDNKKAPDLVLSGINAGANLGTDIIYSGTAAAARQGSFFGIPSIALSLVDEGKYKNEKNFHWEPVIDYIAGNLQEFIACWKAHSFLNINFPNNGKKPAALVKAFPAMRNYGDRIINFTAPGGKLYCFADAGTASNDPDDGSDWKEVMNGNAAFSVISSEPVCSNM
jgi:5'-nucleotidase